MSDGTIHLSIGAILLVAGGGVILGALITVIGAFLLRPTNKGGGAKAVRDDSAVSLKNPIWPRPVSAEPHPKVITPATQPKPRPQGKLPEISVSREGLEDLLRRTSQRINYRVDEAAALLGLDYNQVSHLLASGELKAVMTGNGTKWILSKSIYDLLNRIGIDVSGEDENQTAEEDIGGSGEAPSGVAAENNTGNPRDPVARVLHQVLRRPAPMTPQPGEATPGVANAPITTTSLPAPATKLPFKQFYQYFVAGRSEPLITLRDAMAAVGRPVPAEQSVTWNKIPADLRKQIKRTPINPASGNNTGSSEVAA